MSIFVATYTGLVQMALIMKIYRLLHRTQQNGFFGHEEIRFGRFVVNLGYFTVKINQPFSLATLSLIN